LNIAFLNQKGGTGKTTLAVHTARIIAKTGKRVLIIDMDPQGSLSVWLRLKREPSLAELLAETASFENCLQTFDGFSCVASGKALSQVEMALAGKSFREKILSEILGRISQRFDVIIFDLPPSLGLLTLNALVAADHIYVPMSMEFLAMVGLTLIRKNIDDLRRTGGICAEIRGIIPTFVDERLRKTGEIIGSLNDVFGDIVSPPLHQSVRLSEAPSFGKTIFDYAPDNRAADDLLKIGDFIQKRSGISLG